LKFERPVTVAFADAERLRAHFERRLAQDTPPEQARAQDAAFAQLGLLPPGETLAGGLLATLEQQARGYYDPGQDTFYLTQGVPDVGLEVVVAHELTHALDDQHFDIEALLRRARDDDAQLALSALLEGSGTLVMAHYLTQEIAAGRLPPDTREAIQSREAPAAARLAATPPFFQRTLTAPYLLGLMFGLRGDLARLAHALDPRDLDRAFADPPVSTEQVLHPEKYWDSARRDRPEPLTLPDLTPRLGPGFSRRAEGRLGELLLGVLVGAPTPDPARGLDLARWHVPATMGWRGDTWQHYGDGARALSLLATAWDSERDAREFADALRPVARRRVYRHGAHVLLIAGDLQGRFDELAPLALGALGGAAAERGER
jgi:hypothetical protein